MMGVMRIEGVLGDLGKGSADHKYSQGHLLVMSGDHGRSGAARLAARAALRVGTGLVTLLSPRGAMAENAARLEAVMLRQVDQAGELARLLGDARITALCLGPGMGLGARQAAMLAVALHDGRALILDADALTLLAQEAALFGGLRRGVVLTPHRGEFARLFPDIAAAFALDTLEGKVAACRVAAARAGAVVLLKGAQTVVAAPEGRAAVHEALGQRAAPWLATAGSGDVLAGLIAGLCARGFAGFEAACTAAWLHVECALAFGPGLIAEDLPEILPQVLRGAVGGK